MVRLLLLFILIPVLNAQGPPSIEVQLQSAFLVEREEAILTLTVRNLNMPGWPASPVVSPLSLRQLQHRNMLINGRVSEAFSYAISSMKAGVYTVPPFRVGNVVSKPLTLHVFKESDLSRHQLSHNGQEFTYLSGLFVTNRTPYVGETQQIEAKLYLPTRIRVEQPQYADFEKKNLVAWRFDPTEGNGAFRLDGETYQTYSYQSTLTPLEPGPTTFGPGSVSPLLNFRLNTRRGFVWQRAQMTCSFPSLSLDVKSLPLPQPADFSGAVGTFNLTAQPLGLEIAVGDPLTIELTVSGTGNLDQLGAPKLIDRTGAFKQFDVAKKPQGRERTSTTGEVEFSQVIRPNQVIDTIPPYHLHFFDPILKEYRLASTPPIPITVTPGTPSTAPSLPASPDAPKFLPPGSSLIPANPKVWPPWLWQILPALLALFLLLKKFRPRIAQKKQLTQRQKEFEKDLGHIADATTRVEFYRRAALLIEEDGPDQCPDDLNKIIKTRDEICFRPDASDAPLLPKERTAILDLLRTLAPLIILAFLILAPAATGQEPDWSSLAKDNPTPEAFHNLALQEEMSGRLPTAALYFYRYQAYGGDDAGLERILGQTRGIKRPKPQGMEHLSVLPKPFFQQAGAAALWGLALTLLVIVLHVKRWLPFLIPLTLIASVIWWIGFRYYPDNVGFLPLTQLSVVMVDTKASSSPYQDADGIEIPATSIGHVTGTSGKWSHLKFPNGIKGWVPSDQVAPIRGVALWNPPTSQTD
ncbi:MAG: hypothetical protein ACSHYF_02420 [Verrucomicrobiaceae bacterium]